ncbi:MAG: hypothetical protein ABI199_11240 [Bacteroidia bacterium]
MKKYFFALFIFFGLSLTSYAQVDVKDSLLQFTYVAPSYAFQIPGGDLAKRFGANSNIGLRILHKTRNNWIYGLEGSYLFSNNVKEYGILDSISTQDGYVIDQNGTYAEIRLSEEGFMINALVGKILPLWQANKNSGVLFTNSIGYIQHKIKIVVLQDNAYQLSDTYKKGYERLTAGINLTQFLGYQYFGTQHMLNFFGGFEITEAFTNAVYPYEYDLRISNTSNRIDLLYGFRIGWMLPFYRNITNRYYYN